MMNGKNKSFTVTPLTQRPARDGDARWLATAVAM